jgi:hypothetical protein
MSAYKGFSEKQQAALEHLRQEVKQGNQSLEDALAGLGDDLNGIYQYLTSREKAALYHLETPTDLKDLEEPEQQYLLAVLYQLADDEAEVTENQRAFIRSVQRYLGITNPQTSADLTAVGDIDSLDVQKAFLRVALEFFYLQDGDEISEEQEDFLSNFSINKKQTTVIENSVSRLYNAVGAGGIAEKYGFVPEGEEQAEEDDTTEWEEQTITFPVQINKGETVSYKNKIIHIGGEIICNGNLRFENCQIHYAESQKNVGKIDLGRQGTVDFCNCKIESHAYIASKENRRSDDKEDVGHTLIQADPNNSASARFDKCSFTNCCQLLNNVDTSVEQCQITNPGPNLFSNMKQFTMTHTRVFLCELPAFLPTGEQYASRCPCIIKTENLKMMQCEVSGAYDNGSQIHPSFIYVTGNISFDGEETTIDDVSDFSIENCRFHDTNQTLIHVSFGSSCAIRRCVFERCTIQDFAWATRNYGYLFGGFYIINCRFDDCGTMSLLKCGISPLSIIELCQFNGGAKEGTLLIYSNDGVLIADSEFNNWRGRKLNSVEAKDGFTNKAMITLKHDEHFHSGIVDCVFQAVHAEEQFIISGKANEKTKSTFISVDRCKFVGCYTKKSELIARQCGYNAGVVANRTKMTPAISISDCTGLENRNGETSSQVKIVPRTCGSTPGTDVGPTEAVGLPT